MSKLRYRYEDRFAEAGKDAPEERKELLDYFDKKIRPKWDELKTDGVGRESDNQLVYHVCYDCNMKVWRGIYDRVKNIAEKCEVYIDWEQIKHVIRFTFLGQPPGGFFMPHVNMNLLALSAFNIPLKGKTEIALFKDDVTELTRHEYKNPCFLNVNKPHGVFNDESTERLILKTHMTVVPWEQLVSHYEQGKRFKLFDNGVPWSQDDHDANKRW